MSSASTSTAKTNALEVIRIPEAHVRIAVVTAVTGLSESTIRRKVAAGDFPKPIRHGARCTRWVASHVTGWLRQNS